MQANNAFNFKKKNKMEGNFFDSTNKADGSAECLTIHETKTIVMDDVGNETESENDDSLADTSGYINNTDTMLSAEKGVPDINKTDYINSKDKEAKDTKIVTVETMEHKADEADNRIVLSNNFIQPLESVDTYSTCMESVDQNDGGTPKVKKEKKDGRLYKFVKKHILQRKGSSNDVKEIHIVPDGDEFKWARRSGGSAASRSSTGTSGSEGDRLEVVHDMAEEYTQEAV